LQFRVSVYNYAGLSISTIQQAEDVTTRIFRDAGVRVIWLNWPQDFQHEDSLDPCSSPAHIHLRIVKSVRGFKPSTVGVSFISADGLGCSADLFYEPREQWRKRQSELRAYLEVIPFLARTVKRARPITEQAGGTQLVINTVSGGAT
jgi:hypothetical protein